MILIQNLDILYFNLYVNSKYRPIWATCLSFFNTLVLVKIRTFAFQDFDYLYLWNLISFLFSVILISNLDIFCLNVTFSKIRKPIWPLHLYFFDTSLFVNVSPTRLRNFKIFHFKSSYLSYLLTYWFQLRIYFTLTYLWVSADNTIKLDHLVNLIKRF